MGLQLLREIEGQLWGFEAEIGPGSSAKACKCGS